MQASRALNVSGAACDLIFFYAKKADLARNTQGLGKLATGSRPARISGNLLRREYSGIAVNLILLALASQLLPAPGWMALPLVVLAQLWWVAPGVVLRQVGYQQVDSFKITLTLAGLLWALIMGIGDRWPDWLRFAGFGAGYIAIVVVARSSGLLPATTDGDIFLTAIFLPALAVLGGYTGRGLGVWLQTLAGDIRRD